MVVTLADFTDTLLRGLAFLAAAAVLLLALGVIVSLMRSVWSVTVRRRILVLPFRGTQRSPHVAELLTHRLVEVQDEWISLSHKVQADEESLKRHAAASQIGLAARTLSDALMWFDRDGGVWVLRQADGGRGRQSPEVIAGKPLDQGMIGTVTVGGIGFSPDAIVTLLNKLRGAVARQKIVGTLHEFGATVSLRTRFRLTGAVGTTKLIRKLDSDDDFFDAVDDLSFELAKRRIASRSPIEDFGIEANTWKGYRSFLEAHGSHLTFIRTGSALEREDAIRCYEAAIQAEPGYALAHYNLATLLYNRYTPADNSDAIEHFRLAAQTPAPRIEALARAGLAMAYSQNVHRFGKPKEPWVFWAEVESERAFKLEPDLEETCLARAWSNQVLGRMGEAVSWYERAASVQGDTPKARQLQSFALCNAGWICLHELGDERRAEDLLQKSLNLYENKMTHTNLGEIYKRRREFEGAKREFEAAILVDPRYVNALNEFGMLYVKWARETSEEARAAGNGAEHDGAPTTAKLLAEARSWHERAIAVLEDDHEERIRLHELFGEECERYGFKQEAQREMNEAESDRRLATIEESAQGP